MLFPLPKSEKGKNIDIRDIEKVLKDMWEVFLILSWIIDMSREGQLYEFNRKITIPINFLTEDAQKGLNELKFFDLLSKEENCKKCIL